MLLAEKVIAVAVLRVSVDAQVHTNAECGRMAHDSHDVVEVVPLDHGIEPDVVDTELAHPRDRIENSGRQTGNAACLVMAVVEVVKGDAELVDARIPERLGALGGQHRAMRDERDVLRVNGVIYRGYDGLEVASQQRLASSEADEHRIEPLGGVGEAGELSVLLRRVGLPVVTKPAFRVAA